jgi:hypothetical protein
MTLSPDLFLSSSKAPIGLWGDLRLPWLRFRHTSSATPQIGLSVRPNTSRVPSRLTFQPRAPLSVTGKSPFNTQ